MSRWLAIAVMLAAILPGGAWGFAIHQFNRPVLQTDGSVDAAATLEAAIRWSATPALGGAGLHDGLQVGVVAGFEAALGASDPAEVANYQAAIVAAFEAWESPTLAFDIVFDAAPTGYEIMVGFADSSHQLFRGNGFAGVGFTLFHYDPGRTLTNGTLSPGLASHEGTIMINTDLMSEAATGYPHAIALSFLEDLMVHEVGHVIGLGHPHADLNFDSDDDPNTPVAIDPADPFSGLAVSGRYVHDAVMTDPYAWGFPQADDLAGRDVLYPVPAPATGTLLSGAAGVWRLRRRRSQRGTTRTGSRV